MSRTDASGSTEFDEMTHCRHETSARHEGLDPCSRPRCIRRSASRCWEHRSIIAKIDHLYHSFALPFVLDTVDRCCPFRSCYTGAHRLSYVRITWRSYGRLQIRCVNDRTRWTFRCKKAIFPAGHCLKSCLDCICRSRTLPSDNAKIDEVVISGPQ